MERLAAGDEAIDVEVGPVVGGKRALMWRGIKLLGIHTLACMARYRYIVIVYV